MTCKCLDTRHQDNRMMNTDMGVRRLRHEAYLNVPLYSDEPKERRAGARFTPTFSKRKKNGKALRIGRSSSEVSRRFMHALFPIRSGSFERFRGRRYIIKWKTSAVRSRISSKLIFASCVGYFDRAYYGFCVTSSRMLVLTEGQNLTAAELSECIICGCGYVCDLIGGRNLYEGE